MKYLYAVLAFALALFTAACSDQTPPRTVYIEKPVPVYVQPSAGNTEYVQQGPVSAPPVYQQPAYAYQPQPTPVSQPAASSDNSIGAGTALVVGAMAGAATSAAVSHAMNTKAQQSARYVPTPTPAPYVAKPASTYKPLQLASVSKPSISLTKPSIAPTSKPSTASIWSRPNNDGRTSSSPSRSGMFGKSMSTSRSSLGSFSSRR